jgi:NIPSNAP
MERRNFVKASLLAATPSILGAKTQNKTEALAQKELYEWREYEFNFNSPRGEVEKYFKNALIPAFNKQGIKTVGVFTEIGKSDPAKVYLLIPYPSFDAFKTVNEQIKLDEDYKKAATDYTNLTADKPPFNRVSSSLMNAFDGLPKLIVPKNEPRIFEVRSYEGYNEEAVRRKVLMFNKEEFDIFYRTGLNPVFFGEVIAGGNLPRLTYMITFKNMEEHDKNWAKFSADEVWKRISKAPEYANTVSKIYKTFLEPAAYSQL